MPVLIEIMCWITLPHHQKAPSAYFQDFDFLSTTVIHKTLVWLRRLQLGLCYVNMISHMNRNYKMYASVFGRLLVTTFSKHAHTGYSF